MTAHQDPLLRYAPLSKQPVVLLRYQHRPDGNLRASDRRFIDPRQVLVLLDELAVSDAVLDEVADKLGLGRGEDA